MKMPHPPLGISIPALAYLVLETWHFCQDASPALGIRLGIATCLVIAILYERSAALLLWMLYSLFLALISCVQAFGLARSTPLLATGCAALAILALANAGYLFFFHRAPVAAKGEER